MSANRFRCRGLCPHTSYPGLPGPIQLGDFCLSDPLGYSPQMKIPDAATAPFAANFVQCLRPKRAWIRPSYAVDAHGRKAVGYNAADGFRASN